MKRIDGKNYFHREKRCHQWMIMGLTVLLLVCLTCTVCLAEETGTLRLPANLTEIGDEAFMNVTGIGRIVLPDSLLTIGARAFANGDFEEINLPESITRIADDAFSGCTKIMATVTPGSYAESWCENHEIPVHQESESFPESAHPYPDNCDESWVYYASDDTNSVIVTFDFDTFTEDGYDYIYLYDLDDHLVGTYSGSDLSDQSVTVEGKGFKINLRSDEMFEGANPYYGFKVVSVQEVKPDPFTFVSLTAESNTVEAGQPIRWEMLTEGSIGTVRYAYQVTLAGAVVASGTADAPDLIEYVPGALGEHVLTVTATDECGRTLGPIESEPVSAVESTLYPESEHPYANYEDNTWYFVADEKVDSLVITFSGDTSTETNYDFILIYDRDGNEVGKYSGDALAGREVEVIGNSFSIRLTSDYSNSGYGFAVTNIVKTYATPLQFITLNPDAKKVKAGNPVTWEMVTEGGHRPVRYDYVISLSGQEILTGNVIRPEPITFIPMKTGDYTLTVTATDADLISLDSQSSTIRVSAADPTPAEEYTFTSLNGLYAQITGYTGTDTVLTIPSTVTNANGTYTVQKIADNALRGNQSVVSVFIPDTVTEIGSNTFRECSSLVAIQFSENLTRIGGYAFESTALQELLLPAGLEKIEGYAFYDCRNLREIHYPVNWTNASGSIFENCPKLTKIVVPEGVTAIPAYAFSNCASLTEISLPSTLKTIGSNAFENCTNLKSVIFPEGMTAISQNAFQNCKALSAVDIPKTVMNLNGFTGCTGLTSVTFHDADDEAIEENDFALVIGSSAFEGCTGLCNVYLPKGLTKIEKSAFYSCSGLVNIAFPEGLLEVGASAFEGCSGIETLNLPDSVKTIGGEAFRNCVMLKQFRYPLNWQSSTYDYNVKNIFQGCKKLTSIVIPEGVTVVPWYAFCGTEYLTDLTLPSTLTAIDQGAFESCVSLTTVNLPENLQKIGGSAFYHCSNLKNVIFREGLLEIGESAFEGCSEIETLNLPNSVKRIGGEAFRNCAKLQQFRYPLAWESSTYDYNVKNIFQGCEKLTSVVIPEGVTVVPWYAFCGTEYLTDLTLPSTLTAIDQGAFESCVSLTTVNLPENLQKIGGSAFYHCSNLKNVIFPDGLLEIGDSAFEGCSEIVILNLPDSVKTIGGEAFRNCIKLTQFRYPLNWESSTYNYNVKNIFQGCERLTSIDIPEGVTIVPWYAFCGAEYLTDISLPSTLTTIDQGAFESCTSLITLYLPENVQKIGGSAFYNCTNLEILYIPYAVTEIGNDILHNCQKVTIYTEWGATAVQYAIDHEISYYYLSLTGAHIPSGVIYQYYTFSMYGYVRSNHNLTRVTATLYNEYGNPMNTVTVDPETTDYSLSGRINGSFNFSGLPVGKYMFELSAETDLTAETFCQSSFEVKEASLYARVTNFNLSSGKIYENDVSYPVTGTVSANYPMTSVTVTLENGSDTRTWKAAPGTKTFDLSQLEINLFGFARGDCIMKVVVEGHGETVCAVKVSFVLHSESFDFGDDYELDSDACILFASSSANRNIFSGYLDIILREESTVMDSMGFADVYALYCNQKDEYAQDLLMDALYNMTHSGANRSKYMVDLYKKEIGKMLDDFSDEDLSKYSYDKTLYEQAAGLVIKEGKALTKEWISLATNDDQKLFWETINAIFEKVDLLKDHIEVAEDAYELYQNLALDFSRSMSLLNSLEAQHTQSDSERYFQMAVEEFRQEYACQYAHEVALKLQAVCEYLAEKGEKWLNKQALQMFGVSTPYTVITAIRDFMMKQDPMKKSGDAFLDYTAVIGTCVAAHRAYQEAFDRIAGGDTAVTSCAVLAENFDMVKRTFRRSFDYIKACDEALNLKAVLTNENWNQVHVPLGKLENPMLRKK